MQDKDTKKQIAFDLDTTPNGLQTYYDKKYNNAYKELRELLEEYGFERIQGSVYHSKEPISYYTTKEILLEIDKQLPWLPLCLNSRTITEIGSFTQDFSREDKIKAQQKYEREHGNEPTEKKESTPRFLQNEDETLGEVMARLERNDEQSNTTSQPTTPQKTIPNRYNEDDRSR